MICDEFPEFYNEERVTARKAHRCIECGHPIPVGSRYVRCTGKTDGTLWYEKQHEECRDFAAKINVEHIGECVVPFGFVDDAMRNPDDYYDFEPQDIIAFRDEWARIKAIHALPS